MIAVPSCRITEDLRFGGGEQLGLIAGPCVIEGRDQVTEIARVVSEVSSRLGIPAIFKASFDKANRSSGGSFRGLGLVEGLQILREVRDSFGLPVTTDVHETWQVESVAEVVDLVQIPAYLCRQTDLLVEAGRSGRAVNVKKGQFLAPGEMRAVVEKLRDAGAGNLLVTERGSSFGYHNLVVDFRGLVQMRDLDVPVVFDGTHSVQLPGLNGRSSGGQREFIAPLVRAAAAVGVDALFLEVHPRPDEAQSDGPNALPLKRLDALLGQVLAIRDAVRRDGEQASTL